MIEFGIDRIIAEPPADLRVARIGLVTSDVARTARGQQRSREALLNAGFKIVRLFGPEHGLAGTAADGTHITNSNDPVTGVPVISLYGATMRPPTESLEDLDAIVFDIPDIGARFYTYIWTLSHVMEACADAGKPLCVLDRPNPIGGNLADAEGPLLDERRLSSFVGRWNIPIRYSLTIGELANLWKYERKIDVDLHIISLLGWNRTMHWSQTQLPFVPISPAMPSYESALLYPGTCLFEGTNISEGRGTEAPFQLIGAPWIDSAMIAQQFNLLNLPGIRAEPASFIPSDRKHSGTECHGVRLIATDPLAVRPVKSALHLLSCIRQSYPSRFQWRPYETAANTAGLGHFDRLVGQTYIRQAIDEFPDLTAQIDQWTDVADWRDRVQHHLLYPD